MFFGVLLGIAVQLTAVQAEPTSVSRPVAAQISGAIIDIGVRVGGLFGPSIRRWKSPQAYQRAYRLLQEAWPLRPNDVPHWDMPAIAFFEGQTGEINAFSLGRTIYLSKEAHRLLSDGELRAMILHETGHHFRNHLLERMSFVPLIFVTSGPKKYSHDFEAASAVQEIQADCIAYNWLERLKQYGLGDPSDLISTLTKITALSKQALMEDEGLGERAEALVHNTHLNQYCY